jgi:hypothetical protein
VVIGGHPFDQPGDHVIAGRTSVSMWVGPLRGYQHQQLNVLGRRRAAEQHQQARKPEEDQVEQMQRHGFGRLRAGREFRSANLGTASEPPVHPLSPS